MRSFVKIKSSPNGEITLSTTDIVKSCSSRDFLLSQVCLLTLFAKIKISRNFLDLQYNVGTAAFYLFIGASEKDRKPLKLDFVYFVYLGKGE